MTKIADPSVMAKNVIKFGPPPQIDKEDDDDAYMIIIMHTMTMAMMRMMRIIMHIYRW